MVGTLYETMSLSLITTMKLWGNFNILTALGEVVLLGVGFDCFEPIMLPGIVPPIEKRL
jgi:hypothetical protein